jgi:hypothetical protein
LEACFLCKKPLGDNRDIFMYRLDISNHISPLSSQLVGFYFSEMGSHDFGSFLGRSKFYFLGKYSLIRLKFEKSRKVQLLTTKNSKESHLF